MHDPFEIRHVELRERVDWRDRVAVVAAASVTWPLIALTMLVAVVAIPLAGLYEWLFPPRPQ